MVRPGTSELGSLGWKVGEQGCNRNSLCGSIQSEQHQTSAAQSPRCRELPAWLSPGEAQGGVGAAHGTTGFTSSNFRDLPWQGQRRARIALQGWEGTGLGSGPKPARSPEQGREQPRKAALQRQKGLGESPGPVSAASVNPGLTHGSGSQTPLHPSILLKPFLAARPLSAAARAAAQTFFQRF